jgi:hypothetical protein
MESSHCESCARVMNSRDPFPHISSIHFGQYYLECRQLLTILTDLPSTRALRPCEDEINDATLDCRDEIGLEGIAGFFTDAERSNRCYLGYTTF